MICDGQRLGACTKAHTVGYDTFVLYTIQWSIHTVVHTEQQESAKFLELSEVSFWLDSGHFSAKASGTPPRH